MDDTTYSRVEIRCEACGRLFARFEDVAGGRRMEVVDGGMHIEPVNRLERIGFLLCPCQHKTPADLDLFGPLFAP